MKNKFVLDENIIISIVTLKNERSEIDYSASILILMIAKNCHKILITPKINVKYYQKFNEIKEDKTKQISVQVLHIFNHLMRNSAKIIWENRSEFLIAENPNVAATSAMMSDFCLTVPK